MRTGISPRGGLMGSAVLLVAILASPGSVATSPQASAAAQSPVALVVNVDQPGARLDPIFYGLMTEEINYSYDGGLYAELIRNRIFQDRPIAPRGRGRSGRGAEPASANPAVAKNPNLINWWLVETSGASGEIDIDTADPVNTTALKNSLRLDIKSVAAGQRVGVANDGYWGIPVRPHTAYTASFYARASQGFSGPLTVAIEGNDGKLYASGQVPRLTTAWRKYIVKLRTGKVQPTADARFVLSASSPGSALVQPRLALPADIQEPPKRHAHRSHGEARPDEAELPPLSRRELPGGQRFREPFQLEGDHRPAGRAARAHEPLVLSLDGRRGAARIPQLVRRPQHGADRRRLCRHAPRWRQDDDHRAMRSSRSCRKRWRKSSTSPATRPRHGAPAAPRTAIRRRSSFATSRSATRTG